MANCVNKNSQEFKDLAAEVGINIDVLAAKVSVWQDKNGLDKFPTAEQIGIKDNVIQYSLKSLNILTSDKAKQVFEKGQKNGWSLDKILTELQIPKEQKQIILDKGISNKEEIITSLLAENSFVVEINLAMQTKPSDYAQSASEESFNWQGINYYQILDFNDDYQVIGRIYYKGDNETSEKEYMQAYSKAMESKTPTQHYSSLTVPGGTNYAENEIATPAITPSIKGHAQFTTDKGIGWFRADEQIIGGQVYQQEEDDYGPAILQTYNSKPTKTRRILEVQSDLFQKGRDKELLAESKTQNRSGVGSIPYRTTGKYAGLLDKIRNKANEVLGKTSSERPDGQTIKLEGNTYYTMNGMWYLKEKEFTKQNQFLQLLNKDNNWVTFFVKSIIQDSAKKGYEKVLFPLGDTAAKIEGHQTLEEFKKQKEDRIKELEEKQEKLDRDFDQGFHGMDTSEYDASSDNINRELDRLEQELADVESGQTQLSSIANFYENTITNILKKNGYNPVEITDEYGNTWNEITLEDVDFKDITLSKGIQIQREASKRIEDATRNFQASLSSIDKYVTKLNEKETDTIATTEDKINRMQEAFDAVVIIDTSLEVSGQLLSANHPLTKLHRKPVIKINPEILFSDTVFHEFGHLYIDLLGGMSDPVIQDAIISLQGSELWDVVESQYPELNSENLAKEVLATALGLEANMVWKKDTTKRSIWQTIKDILMNALKSVLEVIPGYKVSINSVEQLAKEMLSNKLRLSPEAKFNAMIDQNSKNRLDNPTQSNIDALFKHLRENYISKEINNERFYESKEGERFDKSVSKFAKNISPSFVNHRKGSWNIDMNKGWELTKGNLETIIGSSSIPIALDQALDAFFQDNLSNTVEVSFVAPQEMKWNEFLETVDRDDSNPINRKDLIEQIIKNIDVINEAANDFQIEKELPLVAGNMVHKAIEDYVNFRTPFPSTIVDEINELFSEVEKIITEGEAKGSKFYAEQTIFSETAKMPGTIDLIEITKDAKYRIYDTKTYTSFNRRGNKKSNWEMFVVNGYLNQILTYSTILQEYNLQPAEDFLNILAIEVDKDNLREDGIVRITEVRNQKISTKDRAFTNYIREANNKILPMFTSAQRLKDFKFKDHEDSLNDLALKIQRDIKKYNKLTSRGTGKFVESPLEENILLKRIEKDSEKFIGENNAKIIMSYIENMRTALYSSYVNSTAKGQDITKEYVNNIEYLLQTSTLIPDVITFLHNQSADYEIDGTTKNILIELLNEMSEEAEKLKKYKILKSKELAIHTLVTNSNFMEGLWREKYQIEGRKLGKKGEELDAYIEENVIKDDSLIKAAEYSYWTDIFNNGYTDIRYFEYLLADPGMNKSQFVQVVKNILDKSDMAIRTELDKDIADLIKWQKNLKMNTKGDPKKVWGKFLATAKYKDFNNKEITYTHSSVIPEKTSQYREIYLKFKYKEEFIDSQINRAKRNNDKKRYDELIEINREFRKMRDEHLELADPTLYDHPDFVKLSEDDKATLREIHKHLEAADSRLELNPFKKLIRSVGKEEQFAKIYNLPKARKSMLEASYNANNLVDRMKSGLDEYRRPAQDEDDLNVGNDGGNDHFEERTVSTDIVGDPSYDVPVYYRNVLDNPNEQSFDIPTLLAMNYETTTVFNHYKMIEADLYMITSALKETKAFKTDSVLNRKLVDSTRGVLKKELIDPNNLVLKGVEASIRNRFYKRSYHGVYSGLNYKLIKSGETINKLTGMILLAGNFGSASMTTSQGTLYRFIEAVAGEDFDKQNMIRGSKKTRGDVHNMISDSQRHFPQSKTMLLVRRFGLDTQYKALANKFVQQNFITKNLDENMIFALTSMSEILVTSSLMYTLMDNIKVMDKDGNYIDKDGKKVAKKDAMTLDEAYSVVDGKLVLNKHVVYTERNLTNKFIDNIEGEATVAATEISRYIRSKYADLFGQYNQDMKSVAEMHIAGKMAFSMRKWLPRGMHARWRGITTALPFSKNKLTFAQLREEQNLDKRFYSQDQKKFQEGYWTTGFRYFYSLRRELQDMSLSFSAFKDASGAVKSTMTLHEIANLKRLASEFAVLTTSMAASLLLRAVALGLEDDDKDRDKIYFAAYLAQRIHDETAAFSNPRAFIDIIRNPAASINTLIRFTQAFENLFFFTYNPETGEYDANITSIYQIGPRKGEYKIKRNIENLLPFVKKTRQFLGILGFETKESIADSYKYLIRM